MPAIVIATPGSSVKEQIGANYAAFDLKAYNDEVLSHGMPPFRLLRALMLKQPIE